MREHTLRVFISSTTQDLASCRTAVKEELLTAGILPVSQENFGPDYHSLKEFLRVEIAKCDAVICLVGSIYGYTPNSTNRRSYAQIEYDYALFYNKPIFIFLTSDHYVPENLILEAREEQDMQNRHREYLKSVGHKWETFTNAYDLRLKVAQAIRKLPQPFSETKMFYLHPPKRPSYFFGRVKEIEQLKEALNRLTPVFILVIGMGGQGKTTLVHRVLLELENFPFAWGFWCSAYRGNFTFDMFLDQVLTHLLKGKFDKRDVPEIRTRISLLLKLLQQQPVLLVIDGIERWLQGWNTGYIDSDRIHTIEERMGFHEGLDEFLQDVSGVSNGTHLILTSRALPAALDQIERTYIPVRKEDENDMTLEGLDPPSSISLLQELGVKGNPDELQRIAQSYTNHPLALTIFGTLLKKKYGGHLDRLPQITPMDPRHELFKLFDEIRSNLPSRENAENFLKVASQCFENPSIKVLAKLFKSSIAMF